MNDDATPNVQEALETLRIELGDDDELTLEAVQAARHAREAELPPDDPAAAQVRAAIERAFLALRHHVIQQCVLASDSTLLSSGGDAGTFDPEILTAGSSFGPFEIVERLGSGASGVVFKAIDNRRKQPVAIKVYRPHLAQEQFLEELVRMRDIQNEHVLNVYDLHTDKHHNAWCMSMQLLEGSTLRKEMTARHQSGVPWTPQEFQSIAVQACDALQKVHDKGIVHLDVKPSNLWLSKSPTEVKLMDFGTSRVAAEKGNSSRSEGTFRYMSPEQIKHPGEEKHYSDQYSLARVFYEMIAGEVPDRGNPEPLAHCRKLEVSDRVCLAIDKALSEFEGQRHPTMGDFRRAMYPEPIYAPAEPLHEHPGVFRWVYERTWAMLGALAILVTLATAAIQAVVSWGDWQSPVEAEEDDDDPNTDQMFAQQREKDANKARTALAAQLSAFAEKAEDTREQYKQAAEESSSGPTSTKVAGWHETLSEQVKELHIRARSALAPEASAEQLEERFKGLRELMVQANFAEAHEAWAAIADDLQAKLEAIRPLYEPVLPMELAVNAFVSWERKWARWKTSYPTAWKRQANQVNERHRELTDRFDLGCKDLDNESYDTAALLFSGVGSDLASLELSTSMLLEELEDTLAPDANGRLRVHRAAKNGDLQDVTKALELAPGTIDERDLAGWTPLLIAIEHGHRDVAEALLDQGANPTIYELADRYQAIHMVAIKGDVVLLDRLLTDPRVDIDAKATQNVTALYLAARFNNAEVAKQLLIATPPASLLPHDKIGDTAFHLASYHGHLKTFRVLLPYYEANLDLENDQGQTALTYALSNGHREIARLIREAANRQ